MKFTRSKDDKLRASVRIEYRIGLDYLQIGLVHALNRGMIEDADKATRAVIYAGARDALQDYGYDASMHYTDVDLDDFGTDEEEVEYTVARLFPELEEPS